MGSNEQTLKDAITNLLKAYGLEDKIKEKRLIDSWEKIMGRTIAKRTTDIFIKKKKLYISLDSAPLRQELSYAKEKIISLINDECGENLVEDVVLV